MFLLPMAAMASDPCDSPADGLICTERGQMLCGQIPWIGGPALAVSCTLGILTRARGLRYAAVLVWLLGLAAMFIAVDMIAGTYHPR
jgi:hypothetical protein